MKSDLNGATRIAQNSGSLTPRDSAYPRALMQVMKRPPELYYRGNVSLLNRDLLFAVVGSRTLTMLNRQCLTMVLRPIIRKPIVIISGMAIGLDTIAHTIAIDNELPTIAILGSSVEPQEIYPRSNKVLAEAIIAAGGLLISPFPQGTAIKPYNFPARNSIIGALARATLIASAAKNSGALITARYALDYGRDVLVIPGPIDDPLFMGSNRLLQDGATPILAANDILRYFGMQDAPIRSYVGASPEEEKVLRILTEHACTINELTSRSELSGSVISHIISRFELSDWIEILPDGGIRLQ